MFGLTSLQELDTYLKQQWGRWVAKFVAALATLAVVAVCFAAIAFGVRQVLPVFAAVAGLVSGRGASVPWASILPALISALVFGGIIWWVHRRLTVMTRTVEVVCKWLSEPLENRLKDIKSDLNHLRDNTPGLESTNQVFTGISEQVADLTRRVSALESHTDISGLRKMLSARILEAMKNKQSMTIGDMLQLK